jgi:hypothetical protein
MDYDKLVFNIHQKIFVNSEIINNEYRLFFLNCEKNFFSFAEMYYKSIKKEMNRDIIELSILFEYIYINQIIFFKIYENSVNHECLDLLTFLSVNINITKNIKYILNSIDCSGYVIDILNTTRYTDYISNLNYDINKIKKSLLDVFLKIISR